MAKLSICGIHMARQAISKVLQKLGIASQIALMKPKLTPQHKKAHSEFARRCKNWGVEGWKKSNIFGKTKLYILNRELEGRKGPTLKSSDYINAPKPT